MTDHSKTLVKLTGLWKNEREGRMHLGGSLGSSRLLIFPNRFKEKQSDPDYIAYLAESKPKPPESTEGRLL